MRSASEESTCGTTDSNTGEITSLYLKIPKKLLNRKQSKRARKRGRYHSYSNDNYNANFSEAPPYVTVTTMDREGHYHTYGGYGFDMRKYSPIMSLQNSQDPNSIIATDAFRQTRGPNFNVAAEYSRSRFEHRGDEPLNTIADGSPQIQDYSGLPEAMEYATIMDVGKASLLDSLDSHIQSLRESLGNSGSEESLPRKRQDLRNFRRNRRKHEARSLSRNNCRQRRQMSLENACILDEGEGSLNIDLIPKLEKVLRRGSEKLKKRSTDQNLLRRTCGASQYGERPAWWVIVALVGSFVLLLIVMMTLDFIRF